MHRTGLFIAHTSVGPKPFRFNAGGGGTQADSQAISIATNNAHGNILQYNSHTKLISTIRHM